MATSDIGKAAFLNARDKDTGEIEKKTLIPPAPSDGDLGGISEEKLAQITKNKENISSLRENLVVRQKEQPTDPNNNVWISDEDDEVEVPDMGEFNSLKEDLYDLNIRDQFSFVSATLSKDKGIDATSGDIRNVSWHSVTDFIPVIKGDVIVYSNLRAWFTTNSSNCLIIGVYDTDKKYLPSESVVGNDAEQTGKLTIKYNGFIRFCSLNETFPENNGAAFAKITSAPIWNLQVHADESDKDLKTEINNLEGLSNPAIIEVIKNCTVGENAVGNTITFTQNGYRACAKVKVNKTISVLHFIFSVGDSESVCCVVTDKDGSILKLVNGTNTKETKSSVYLADIPDAEYVYWTFLNGRTPYCFYEFADKYEVRGEKVKITSHKGLKSADKIADEDAILFNITAEGTGDITFTMCGGFNIGLWIKMPNYEDVKNVERINIKTFNGISNVVSANMLGNFLQLGNWILVTIPFDDNWNERTVDKIQIIPSFISGYNGNVKLLISPFVVVNHYAKPFRILNYDSFWGASEKCGLYDYLINNKIPFTVTGVFNDTDTVSEEMKNKLISAYHEGLLDVGIYTNEQPSKHPISTTATNYIEVKNAMEHLIEAKIKDGFYPTSIGAGQHQITRAIQKVIETSGFTCTRGGMTENANINISVTNGNLVYECGSNESIERTGGTSLSFSHGVSNNPEAETMPYLYADWTDYKKQLDKLVLLRDSGRITILNMKQYAEYRKAHFIIP